MINLLPNAQLFITHQLHWPAATPGQYLWPNWHYEGDGPRQIDTLDSGGSGVHGNARIAFQSAGQAGFGIALDHHDVSYAIREGWGGRPLSLQVTARCTGPRMLRTAPLVWNGPVQDVTLPMVAQWNGPGVLPTLAAGWHWVGTPSWNALAPAHALLKNEGLTCPTNSPANMGVLFWIDDAQAGDVFDLGEPQLETATVCSQFAPVDFPTTRARTQYNYYTTYAPGTAPGTPTTEGAIERQLVVANTSQVIWPVEWPTTMWNPTDPPGGPARHPIVRVFCPMTGAVNKVWNATQGVSMSAGVGPTGSQGGINGCTVTLNDAANPFDRFLMHLEAKARFVAPNE